MEEVRYQEMKNEYIKNIIEHMTETGDMFTHIALFGTKKDLDNKEGIIHIPISSDFLKSAESKNIFFTDVAPTIAKKLKEEFEIYSSCFTSEAWIRKGSKDDDFDEVMSKAVKEEVLVIIYFTQKDGIRTEIYDVERVGKKVNEDGELVDIVNLKYNEEFSKIEDRQVGETPMVIALKSFV